MNADYSKFNLKEAAWVPGKPTFTVSERIRLRAHAAAVREQAMKIADAIREANKAALSTPLLAALWAFFDKEGGWDATQDGTKVSFEGDFDLKELAAVIEALK